MQISSEYWVPLLVKTAVERYGVKRPAVISGLNDYSKAMLDETAPAFTKYGIDLVANENFNDGDTDFSSQLIAIKNAGADALFVYGYANEVGILFRQRADLEMTNIESSPKE